MHFWNCAVILLAAGFNLRAPIFCRVIWFDKESIKPPEPQSSTSRFLKAKQLLVSEHATSPPATLPSSLTVSSDPDDPHAAFNLVLAELLHWTVIVLFEINKPHGHSLQANYTDLATAACR
jgi:hypothetical protein